MLVLSEVVVRALFAEQTVLFPRYHTDVTYGEHTIRRIRPNSQFYHRSVDGRWRFTTNSQGFRNYVDFEYDKAPGVFRVVSLGDSHTQGYEVRQDFTFSAVMERYLRRAGFNAEVLNTGVSGFGTAEQLVLLEQEMVKYRPDVVVLGFFANDLEDNLKSGLFELDAEGNLVEASFRHVPGVRIQNLIYSVPGVRWLSENSYFYSMLFNTTWEFFKVKLARDSAEAVTEFAVPQTESVGEYDIALTSALLRRLHEVCVDQDILLIVLDIPMMAGHQGIATSFPDVLGAEMHESSDVFIESTGLLGEFAGVAEMHVPNGHNHISEFSHLLLGMAAGKAIVELMGDPSSANNLFQYREEAVRGSGFVGSD